MKNVLKQLSAEKQKIEKEVGLLRKRLEAIDLVFATLGMPEEKPARKPRAKVAAKAPAVPDKRLKGKMSVREAIIDTVKAAKKPLAVKEIIAGAVPRSGGAESSIRTQINMLAKVGLLEQLDYAGRGYQYGPGKGAGVAAKKPGRKPGRKPAVVEAPVEAPVAAPPAEGQPG